MKIKSFSIIVLLVFALGVVITVATQRFFGKGIEQQTIGKSQTFQNQKIVDEESVVIDVVEKVSPSVVSIAVENRQVFNPFGFSQPQSEGQSGIGTGFVVSKDGLILTNKHVNPTIVPNI